MKWSLRLGAILGIGVYVHWTFLLLVAWVLYQQLSGGASPARAGAEVAFVLSIFLCVVLHEFGHALTARRFGVRTRDIILLPIGGVARLERMPDKPGQEFLVAIAGPAVNVVIAGLLLVILSVGGGLSSLPRTAAGVEVYVHNLGFLERLLHVNVMLVLFNMIPAFPMDGGRILRAALATQLDHASATRIAAGIGQLLAVGFAAAGLFLNPWLLLIAAFVFLGAQAESQAAQTRGVLDGVAVRDAMVTEFRALASDATLEEASAALLAGSQQDFPVLADERVVGVLPRADLFKALAGVGPGATVGAVMRRDCAAVSDSEPLTRVFERMQESGCPLVPVERDGRLVGLVTLENIGELFMLKSAVGRRTTSIPGTEA
jgi:Zn-dependent protease